MERNIEVKIQDIDTKTQICVIELGISINIASINSI